jgi:hypothetical protein
MQEEWNNTNGGGIVCIKTNIINGTRTNETVTLLFEIVFDVLPSIRVPAIKTIRAALGQSMG